MRLQRLTAIVLISITLANGLILIVPQSASAVDIGDRSASFTGCFTSGLLTPVTQQLINAGLKKLQGEVSGLAKGFVKGVLSGFLGGLLSSTIPTDDKAGESIVAYMANRDYQQAVISRCAGWSIMDNMTKNTLDLVRTGGRDGGTTYVKNWLNFQTGSQHRGENVFRAMLSTAELCGYFKDDVRSSFGLRPGDRIELPNQNTRANSLQTFGQDVGCSLPQNFNMGEYQQDFAGNGGWDTWSQILEPQNNPFSVAFRSQEEIQKQRSLAQSADMAQVIANGGHLGVSGNGRSDSCLVQMPTGDCVIYKDIKTPGSYVAQNVAATAGHPFTWLTSAQGINTIIADATQVMLGRLFDLGNPNEESYNPIDPNKIGSNLLGTSGTPTPSGPPAPTTNPIFNICSSQSLSFMNNVKEDLASRELVGGIFGGTDYTPEFVENIIVGFELRKTATPNSSHQNQIESIQNDFRAIQSMVSETIPPESESTVLDLKDLTIADIETMVNTCQNPSEGGGNGGNDDDDGGGFDNEI